MAEREEPPACRVDENCRAMTRPGNFANTYAFGAGRVPLAPSIPATRSGEADSLARELFFLLRESCTGGPGAVLARFARGAILALTLILLIPAVVNRVLLQPAEEESELRIVSFKTPAPQPATPSPPTPAPSSPQPETRPSSTARPSAPAPRNRARPVSPTPARPAPALPTLPRRPVSRPDLRIDALALLPKTPLPSAPPTLRPDRPAPARSTGSPRPRIDLLSAPRATGSTPSVRHHATLPRGGRITPAPGTGTLPPPPILGSLPSLSIKAERASQPVRAEAKRIAAGNHTHSATLNGVPLAALASCVSDREEDRLKQRIIAVARDNTKCVNQAGRYRFVQTRNLNSFLMWVERSSRRTKANRCVELHHALTCLETNGAEEA